MGCGIGVEGTESMGKGARPAAILGPAESNRGNAGYVSRKGQLNSRSGGHIDTPGQ